MNKPDFKTLSKLCIEKTARLTEEFPSRLSGSEECKLSANALHDEIREFCCNSFIHPFTIYPDSFYGYLKLFAPFYLSALITFFLPPFWRIIPLIGLILGIVMMIVQFGVYRTFFDRLYKKKTAYNVIGEIEPTGEVKEQIILSGHHDSAPLTGFNNKYIDPYLVIIFFTVYAYYLFAIGLFLYSIVSGISELPLWSLITLISGLPLVFIQFFAVNMKKGSPGAGDNMISSVVSIEVGRIISQNKVKNPDFLKHTRIIIASFDGEEAGLRGARAYFNEHNEKFTGTETFHLNMDCLYNEKELQILKSDINNIIKLDDTMVDELVDIAKELNIELKPFKMIFGGGGTDAGESARKGIRSTSIIAMPTGAIRKDMVYHSIDDKADTIEPEVISTTLNILWKYLESRQNY